ncbi:hypothetical protein FNF31_02352 [Cafeteria roenbergensis]|uniref:dUTP diphosphatase n=1 Tax=Cafeteria roenbergensis TaxID=33653 RepID=A0A5A8DGJ6_CAFRO|nr:hypothetical protein FNF31_02352 [Cafeteria roenbergensis]
MRSRPTPSQDGSTALMLSAAGGHAEVVNMLLLRGADIAVENHAGFTALHHAIAQPNLDTVALLLDHGTPLERAPEDGALALAYALVKGNLAAAALLLERGACMTSSEHELSAMQTAVESGLEGSVRLLLDHGASVNARGFDGWTPLMHALCCPSDEVTDLLLDRGADVHAMGTKSKSPLLIAAGKGLESRVENLLARGVNINAQDARGTTALMCAVNCGRYHMTTQLLDRGADHSLADSSGATALILATSLRRMDEVELLLDRGANLEAADRDGRTPLMYAASGTSALLVRLLLARGASVEAKSHLGWTALTTAACFGSVDIMRLLVAQGADLECRDASAVLPTRGSALAAGYDLSAAHDGTIPARGKALIKTDLAVAIPEGCYGRVAPRSGLAWKHSIDVGAGVIDADYRGNVGVILFNLSDTAFDVKAGDRIAQLVLERIATPDVVEVDDLEASDRGAGGFGSTGGFAESAAKRAKPAEDSAKADA